MKWDVIGFGAVAVDDLIYINRFPSPGQKEKIIRRIRQGGGLAGTALVACSRLGVHAAYVGILGFDELSQFTLDELKREGVDTSIVNRKKGTGPYYSTIIVEHHTGERIILFSPEAVENPSIDDLPEEDILDSKVVFLDYTVIDAAEKIISLAHSRNIPIVADIELIEDSRIFSVMALVDHLIVNLEMGRSITHKKNPEEIIRFFQSNGTKNSIVTDGANGCWYQSDGKEIAHQPAFMVDVVDTTGCGDVFHGAYATALALGMGIPESVKLAAATAALKATKPGGRLGIPSFRTAKKFIEDCKK
jgi:sugar/nucleoside kinase (ribokinase family)